MRFEEGEIAIFIGESGYYEQLHHVGALNQIANEIPLINGARYRVFEGELQSGSGVNCTHICAKPSFDGICESGIITCLEKDDENGSIHNAYGDLFVSLQELREEELDILIN